MTNEQAMNLVQGSYIHYGTCVKTIGPRGGVKLSIEKWKVGAIKIWKRTPGVYLVSIHHGLYDHGHIGTGYSDPANFHREEDCNPKIIKKTFRKEGT